LKLEKLVNRSVILFNLFTLTTGLIWNIDVRFFLLFYWLESIIAGIFNIIKMATVNNEESPITLKAFLIPFFIIHYGLFNAGHLVFLVFFINQFNTGVTASMYVFEHVRLFALNLALLLVEYIQELKIWASTDADTSVGVLMFKPYGRIVVMHITIISGATLYFILGSNRIFIVLLMVLKTIVDLLMKRGISTH